MKPAMIITAAVLAPSLALAGGHGKDAPGQLDTNWGELTAGAIADGFDQGTHSADPSGDGHGPEDRVGLANVVDRGDMGATTKLIDSLLR